MKVGDIVVWYDNSLVPGTGIIVGFNEKGEGGQHYVHILNERGAVVIAMSHTLEVIEPEDKIGTAKNRKH